MTSSAVKTPYSEAVWAFRAQPVKLPWVEEMRNRALKAFDEKRFPDRHWESWRYFSPAAILKTGYLKPQPSQTLQKVDPSFFADARCRIVFVDGLFSPKLSSQAPGNVDFSELWAGLFNATDLHGRLGCALESEENPFFLINTFSFEDGALIRIPAGRKALEPLHLFFFTTGDQGAVASAPRILLVAEENSEAVVLCHFYGGSHGSNTFENAAAEIHLDAGARVQWINLQTQKNVAGSLFFNTRAYIRAGAELEMTTVSRGREVTRNEVLAHLEGSGAQCRLSGLSVLSGASRVHNEMTVNHKAEETVSRQFYKNLLDGDSQAEFNSLAHVFPGAQKSDSNQLNKNLLLSDDAHVYSRPKLKIYADDVQASHGSATGQADGQELFYLRSRGLDLRTARFVLSYGFAEEILMKIPVLSIREKLETLVKDAIETMIRE